MSFGLGGQGFGPGAGTARFSSTRGRMQGGANQGVNYPSPFFDVAHTYLPVTVKQLFRWCRYYFLTNPLINATVFKLSEYPITDLTVEHENPEVKERWENYFREHLRYRPFQIECGLDYYTYGNAMISLGFPFHKYLKCQHCRFTERADKIRQHWSFTNLTFRLSCPKCGNVSEAEASDFYYRDANGINPIRWNCEHVEVTYNDVTGESTYFYTIPPTVRNDVVIGKKDVVESVPQVFIQAMRQNKGVVFSKDNFFHMKRPTLAQQDRGWGTPIVLPVLKDTFYLQIMKKAQEAILLEHIVPLRVLFPQAGSGSSDPYCVSPDTLVETIDGLKPASEVREGDYLRSHTGAWRRTEATKRRAINDGEKAYKFTVASLAGMPFEISEGHPVLAVPKTGRRGRQKWTDPEFIDAKDLRVGDYAAYPVNRKIIRGQEIDLKDHLPERAHTDEHTYLKLSQPCAEIFEWLEGNYEVAFGYGERKALLAEKGWHAQEWENAFAAFISGDVSRFPRHMPITKELAALVGYYLAEGSSKGSLVSLAFHSDEHAFHSEVTQCVKALGFKGATVFVRREQHAASVDINSVILSGLLKSLCGTGFLNKRIPQELAEAPNDVVVSMLRCLFNGDGCSFETDTNRVALKSSNPSMLMEARRLLLYFGFIGGVAKEEPTDISIHKAAAYHLNYNGVAADGVRALFAGAVLQAPPRQKSGVYRDWYVLMPIRKIEEVEVPEVIGFQMAMDKSFCVAGVATHNTTINLVDWRDHVGAEIGRWRQDNNYIPIMPLPIGNQTIGGDGRALLLTQEIQTWSEHIMSGLGVPREFLLGGMSYSGSNVSMRMLENQFLGFILRHTQMANWIMKQVAAYMGWPEATIRFKPFKMADDIQRKAYLFQLNQAQKVSDRTLLADADLDQVKEDKIMMQETDLRLAATKKQQLALAEVQGEAQVVMSKAQVKAQQVMAQAQSTGIAPGEPGGGETGAPNPMQQMQSQLSMQQETAAPEGSNQEAMGVDLESMAQQMAQQIVELAPEQQRIALDNLASQSPELAQMVQQMMQQMQGPTGSPQGAVMQSVSQVDMRPQPEQLPARRVSAAV